MPMNACWLQTARGHYMQPTNLNLKAIARDAALRGDTKTLFHALDLLERVVPIATFMDFAANLRNSACRGRAHGRTETFGTSSIQQHFASSRQTGTIVPVSISQFHNITIFWFAFDSARPARPGHAA